MDVSREFSCDQHRHGLCQTALCLNILLRYVFLWGKGVYLGGIMPHYRLTPFRCLLWVSVMVLSLSVESIYESSVAI